MPLMLQFFSLVMLAYIILYLSRNKVCWQRVLVGIYLLKVTTLFLLLFALTFSTWLMWKTFNYDSASSTILINSKVWSDFASHLPLIRSFSLGENWPPQNPVFPGEPIRYHFLFYMLVGVLEKLGLRLDLAVNIPSVLGFMALVMLIFIIASRLFEDHRVGLVALVFFLFNGSWSFIDYFKKQGLSLKSIIEIPHIKDFSSFGPWDGSQISAFWNLNIYTNQRHLAPSFAIVLLILYLSLFRPCKQHVIYIGLLLGSLLFFNQAAFLIAVVYLLWFLFFFGISRSYTFKPIDEDVSQHSKKVSEATKIFRLEFFICCFNTIKQAQYIKLYRHLTKKFWLFPCFLILIPFIILSRFLINTIPSIAWHFGFLMNPPITLFTFIKYWLLNIGLHLFLIPLGMYFSPKKAKILIIPTLTLFIVANLLRLSIDIINNHKLFNFFLIIGTMYSAYMLLYLWDFTFSKMVGDLRLVRFILLREDSVLLHGDASKYAKQQKKRPRALDWEVFIKVVLRYALVPILFVLLTFSGVLDLFPIINDTYYSVADIASNPDALFFLQNIPPTKVVLNIESLYHPASLAGRPIFNGYSYFTWSHGYNCFLRESIVKSIYSASTKEQACSLLQQNNIAYLEYTDQKFTETSIRPNPWVAGFVAIYSSPASGIIIYDVDRSCN